MKTKAIVLQMPVIALEWLRKLAIVNGFKDLKTYLVHAILDNLRIWLDYDEDYETHAKLAMVSMFQDGLLEVFQPYQVDLPMDDYFKELMERFKTSQAKVPDQAINH